MVDIQIIYNNINKITVQIINDINIKLVTRLIKELNTSYKTKTCREMAGTCQRDLNSAKEGWLERV